MEIQIQIPADRSGFVRRECPTCMAEFKWFAGATEGRPADFVEPESYFCPYCGVPSGKDTWWTPAQLQYARDAAVAPALKYAQDELTSELGGKRSMFRFEPSDSIPEGPDPLVDLDDMVMVAPPCHSFEPLKVAEDRVGSTLRCLMCGAQFQI